MGGTDASTEFRVWVESTRFDADQVADRTAAIHEALLRESRCLDAGNFSEIHTTDLERLYHLYDERFFGSRFTSTLDQDSLRFRLSRRMTRAGGKTTSYGPGDQGARPYYEIAVASSLLFDCFGDGDHRPISVSGLVCQDRLEALQRIFEHELVHLAELLIWASSSCSSPRFQSIAAGLFGHTKHRHGLITPVERAVEQFDIEPGDRVRFCFEETWYTGFVNRITRRATVLVEDPAGSRYSDGNRYAKFYVPVAELEKSG